MDEDLLMTHEVATLLGVSRTRVLQLARSGRLGHKGGGRLPYYLFTREEVARYKTSPMRRPGRPRRDAPAQPPPASTRPASTPAADPPAPQEAPNIWQDRVLTLMRAGREQNRT